MLVVKEDHKAAELASDYLRQGKIISFATDTVYGLAADASNFKAVETLYQIKNRDKKNPIAIFVKNLAAAKKIFFFDELAKKIAEKFLPGSLTLILKKRSDSASVLASNLNQNGEEFLGFRIVDQEFIKNLFKKFDGNLAVTSANLSKQKPAISAAEVQKYFTNSKLDLLVDGGISKQKIASTVVKICDGEMTILRQGPLNLSSYENF